MKTRLELVIIAPTGTSVNVSVAAVSMVRSTRSKSLPVQLETALRSFTAS